jgi:hypothetical protein
MAALRVGLAAFLADFFTAFFTALCAPRPAADLVGFAMSRSPLGSAPDNLKKTPRWA